MRRQLPVSDAGTVTEQVALPHGTLLQTSSTIVTFAQLVVLLVHCSPRTRTQTARAAPLGQVQLQLTLAGVGDTCPTWPTWPRSSTTLLLLVEAWQQPTGSSCAAP
jgi:hypothetical protein